VQINTEEFQLVLAMNRLRRAYLTSESGLEPYFTTGHHDDERGLVTTYMLHRPTTLRLWLHFLVNTPTIVATVDAALATAIVVLLVQAAEASKTAMVAAVPGRLGDAAGPVAARSAPAPRHAEVPHPTGGTVSDNNVHSRALGGDPRPILAVDVEDACPETSVRQELPSGNGCTHPLKQLRGATAQPTIDRSQHGPTPQRRCRDPAGDRPASQHRHPGVPRTALLHLVSPRRAEVVTVVWCQIASASSANATDSRRFTGSSTASS
jgi:hypothetical protein